MPMKSYLNTKKSVKKNPPI